DKEAVVEGGLLGINGQYLIFDTGVINFRKFTSYEVTVQTPEIIEKIRPHPGAA
ncbi:DUF2797 domain-containing protein, partial [Photobacterium sp. R1]